MAALSDKKIFAGTRIRRLRRDLGATQAQMADDLGISTSYLNLVERNQRPLSAQLLLRLADTFDVDLKDFSGDDEARAAASLKEVLTDPLFEGLNVGNSELADLVGASPATAQAMVTLYRAYRKGVETAVELAEQVETGPKAGPEAHRQPLEEVRDFFTEAGNHFPVLENAVETLWEDAGLDSTDLYHGLKGQLQASHDTTVRVVPADVLAGARWRLDRHSRRLFISEWLDMPTRSFVVAQQLGLLGHRELIESVTADAGLKGDEVTALARLGLANYFAGAVMMPYAPFLKAAEDMRYDVDAIGARFTASYEQVCHRLTTLGRSGARGVPFFFLSIDHAGNVIKQFSTGGFHFARFGGTCPKWNIHEAFRSPGRTLTQLMELEDGSRYFAITRSVSTQEPGGRARLRAVGVGCSADYVKKIAYADKLDLTHEDAATPVGVGCRLCQRADCADRAQPPLNRRLTVPAYQRGPSPFSFEAW